MRKFGLALLYGILLFCLWVFLVYTARPAHAKQVQLECGRYVNEVAQCELHGLPTLTPHWRTTINGRLADHEKGIVVYLTVDERWRGLEIYIYTRGGNVTIIDTLIRYNPDIQKVVFAKENK